MTVMKIQFHSFGGRFGTSRPFCFFKPGVLSVLFLGILVSTSIIFSACQFSGQANDPLQEVKQRGYLTVGLNYGNPPFGLYAAEGDHYVLKGLEVDLSKAVAARLLPNAKEPIRFRQVLTSTRLVALNTKGVDMIAASMSITPNRRQRVSFSIPYFAVHQKVMVPVASPVKSLGDLAGKTVLTINGSTAKSRLQRQFPKIKVKGYATLHDAFTALQNHEGDALSNDDMLLKGLFQQNCSLVSKYRFLPDKLSTEYYGLVFQKTGSQNGNSLLKKVDAILGKMSQDGSLESIKKRWEDFDCL